MTYIEFFVQDALENLCTTLAVVPDKVIMIGDNMRLMKAHKDRYESLLRGRREVVEFVPVSVNKNDIRSILNALDRIVREEEDCFFDLTGGEDACLVAMGIIFERYREKHLQLHRFNIRNNAVYDYDLDGILPTAGGAPQICVDELIYAYGGNVVQEDEYEHGTHEWDWSDEFFEQIEAMWEICREDPRAWNVQMTTLGILESFNDDPAHKLTTTAPVTDLIDILAEQGRTLFIKEGLLKALMQAGLITLFDYDESTTLTVTYCDEQVKRCLTKAGQVLELAVYAAAKRCAEPDGSLTYHDVMTGVTIGWDEEYKGDGDSYDTANEIDVLMTRGLVPVFVSCKNGEVDNSELYKLNAVAGRFGGKYAKKKLVATALNEKLPSVKYFLRRAMKMNIEVITDFHKLDEAGIQKRMRSLWK